jgi:MFS-type transporter involved in bile tolerance (Atg22 family)
LGGLVALVLMLALFAENATTGKTLIGIDPIFGLDTEAREGTRMVGPLAALWYAVFMIPFFLWVREPRIAGVGRIHIGAALGSLRDFIAGLRFRKSLSAYLVSALLYRDALNGLYAFGGVYASNVLGWSITQIGVFGILGALTAVIASWIGGRLDKRFGPKPVLIGAMIILIAVCIVIVGLSRDSLYGIPLDEAGSTADVIFYICGALIGGAGGPLRRRALGASSSTGCVRCACPYPKPARIWRRCSSPWQSEWCSARAHSPAPRSPACVATREIWRNRSAHSPTRRLRSTKDFQRQVNSTARLPDESSAAH